MKIHRDIEDGNTKFAWVNVCNPYQDTANATHWIKAAKRWIILLLQVMDILELVQKYLI